jgi:hypothetical protein
LEPDITATAPEPIFDGTDDYMTTTRKLQQYRDFAGGEDDADDEGE